MGTWSILPSNGATIDSSGKATFPANSTVVQYTITYDDGNGCKVSTLYNIPQDCGGEPPKPIDCIRGTDNGNDIIRGTEEGHKHPMLLCAAAYEDADSIYIPHDKFTVQTADGNFVNLPESRSSAIVLARDGDVDWLKAYWIPDTVTSVCQIGYIGYIVAENNTGKMREATVEFRTEEEKVCDNATPAISYQLWDACKVWHVDFKQAYCGKYWCGEHSYNRTLIDCDQPCSSSEECKSKCGCD